MARTKFNEKSTLMGRMGFKDPDLKDKAHDTMIAWLYNDDTLYHICQTLVLPKIIELEFNYDHLEPETKTILDTYTIKLKHHVKKIELPIKNEQEFDIGFVDLYVLSTITHPYVSISDLGSQRITSNLVESSSYVHLTFEAKSKNISLGELMRQLNIYKGYIGNSTTELPDALFFYFVVAPKNGELRKYQEIIEDHGWIYLECPFIKGSTQRQLF